MELPISVEVGVIIVGELLIRPLALLLVVGVPTNVQDLLVLLQRVHASPRTGIWHSCFMRRHRSHGRSFRDRRARRL